MYQNQIYYQPIGTAHFPIHSTRQVPKNPAGRKDHFAEMEIFPSFQDGLKDLVEFSHTLTSKKRSAEHCW